MITKKSKNRILYFLLSFVLILSIITAFVMYSLTNLSSVQTLEHYSPPIPTTILDVNKKVITKFYSERRDVIPYNEIPQQAINALIATEDDKFFYHFGFNPIRILKAFIVNIFYGRIKQGGSTITQQLAGNLFTGRHKSIKRKILELWYAVKIEKKYTKKEILSFYFNQIWYGHGCYGIQAASKFYFKKDARDLNLAESTLLIGIQPNPTVFSPFRNPGEAMRRHRIVLNSMVREKYITAEQASDEYYQFWVVFRSRVVSKYATAFDMKYNKAPYFIEYLRPKLESIFGKDQVYKGGLIVHTTLDLDRQDAARNYLWEMLEKENEYFKERMNRINSFIDQYVFDHLDLFSMLYGLDKINVAQKMINRSVNKVMHYQINSQLKTLSLLFGMDDLINITHLAELKNEDDLENKAEGALISIEPSTGYISAMVGGSGFDYNNQLNRAMQAYRQIGSLMKPFVYTAAIDTRIVTPATIINDAPIAFQDPSGEYYMPQNYSGKFYGNVRVRTALKKSINVSAIQVLDWTGLQTIRDYSCRMFRVFSRSEIYKKFPQNYTMGLGSGLFSPLEVATAFAVLANEGKEVIPLSIRYVTDRNGKMLRNFEEEYYINKKPRQILRKETAFIITDILNDVLEPGGTAYMPELLEGYDHPSAGKTGTTGNWRDAWFAGYNKYLSTVVWVGFDDNSISLGKGRAGGTLAAPVWINYNREVLFSKKPYNFNKPDGLIQTEICTASGKLPTPYCKWQIKEYFLPGTQPENFCEYHKQLYYTEQEFVDKIVDPEKNKPEEEFDFSVFWNDDTIPNFERIEVTNHNSQIK